MNPLTAITESTCAEGCWHAREDVCRCSCGGRNHGCLRGDDGTQQPNRTRRIKGTVYELAAVESWELYAGSCRAASLQPMYAHERQIERAVVAAGLMHQSDLYRRDNPISYPTYLKTTSAAEVGRWLELATWRGHDRPLTLWVRADLREYSSGVRNTMVQSPPPSARPAASRRTR